MKVKNITALLIYSLIYLGLHMNTYAESSGNDNVILELHQTTPTEIPIQPTAKPVLTTKPLTPTQTGLSFSQQFLSYGFLVPGEPVLRNDIVQIKTTHRLGAALFIHQNTPLKAESAIIPDTSCDNGSCDHTQASIWTSPLTYGFGFRCEKSSECENDFQPENTYRKISISTPSQIMKTKGELEEATIIYKLNISASQAPLPYSNTVTYILVPML